MSNQQIRPGITLTAKQEYRLRVSTKKGSVDKVSVCVGTLDEALALQAEAQEIRDSGGNVGQVWEVRAKRAAKESPIRFGEWLDEYTRRRVELCAISDHKSGAGGKSGSGLRPRTLRVENAVIEKHLRPLFEAMLTTDINDDEVGTLITAMVKDGLAVATQDRVLRCLRHIVGAAPQRRRPADYPWPSVVPIRSASPRKKPLEPLKWGARPNSDKPPAIPFPRGKELAMEMPACTRIVTYLMHIGGLRRGEVMGLDNSAFSFRDGFLWVTVYNQRDLRDSTHYEYTKSWSSSRELPIPDVLREYIEMYWDRYHDGFRPTGHPDRREAMGVEHHRHGGQLVVTSTGRDLEGKFLDARPHHFTNTLRVACKNARFTHADVGFTLVPHHFRKSCATYLLNAQAIAADIFAATRTPEPTNPGDRLDWLARELAAAEQLGRVAITGTQVSAWLGHARDVSRSTNDVAASRVTLTHYNLPHESGHGSLVAIARFLDRVVRHEVGTLIDEPDERDSAPVILPDDPKWVLLEDAAAVTGRSVSGLRDGVRAGRYNGTLVWFADADREPPGMRMAFSSEDIAAIIRRDSFITTLGAANQLSVSRNYINSSIERALLTVAERCPNDVFLDPVSVDSLHTRMIETVAAHFGTDKPTTPSEALRAFKSGAAAEQRYEVPRQLIEDGASYREAAFACGINAKTLASHALRHRWKNRTPLTAGRAAAVYQLWRAPNRVTARQFNIWVEEATQRGLLRRTNTSHYRYVDGSQVDVQDASACQAN